MIAPAQMALGMYDEALATYDEIERRMGADTLNEDYAVILRSRAIAAREKKHYAEAYYYQTRYADLSKILSDSLMKGKANEYAARYHAQEQQLQIQEKEAEADQFRIVSLAVAALALLAVAFAVYFFYQKRIVNEKNRALVRIINGTPPQFADEPAKTVSAIAAEVGFTPANLREQFKRKYGMTPAEYRQNQ